MTNALSNEEFEALLNQYDYKQKRGDLVKGIVYGYDGEGAIVDIGAKSAAVVPAKEVSNDNKKVEEVLEKGKEYEFLVISDADENGKFTLSRKKVDLFYAWQELKKLKEANEIIKGEVVQVVRGGLLVDIIGVRGFVPSSQIQNRTIEYKVGDKIEVFGPNTSVQKFNVEYIINSAGEKAQSASHAQEIVKVKIPFKVQENDILRVVIS